MKSIRSYLLSRLLGGSALVLAVAGAAVFLAVTRSLETQFDLNLVDRVQSLASVIFQVEDDVEFEFSGELMPEYERRESPAYFELRFEDGRLLERSLSLAGGNLVVPETPAAEPLHWTAPLPDGRQGRYAAQLVEVHHIYPELGPDRPTPARVVIVVAMGLEELVATRREILLQCILVAVAILALIAFLAWTALHRGLEPTRRLAEKLDALHVDHLPEGLDLGKLPSELTSVADKMDLLIRRVDTALKRERRTAADIAHELRTPISELLTVSEVALRDGKDPEGTRKALETVRDVSWRMGGSVSTLLKLARLEMGAEVFARDEVDVGRIVTEVLRALAALVRERRLFVENLVPAGDRVEGDGDVLRIVVSNLLSNALYYSPPGGRVECRLERSKAEWRLVVENDTPDLRPEDLRVMSEPFWRKDRARADRSRSGLGLALSRALAERTGLELQFELAERTFRAVLCSHAASGDRRTPGASQPHHVVPVASKESA